MSLLSKFTKLMKHEPERSKNKARSRWIIDESKCLCASEIVKLRKACQRVKTIGLRAEKFSPVRDWFMAELGLNAGLRVAEMASLRHQDLLIDNGRSSITVMGKGEKRRAVWISSHFKRICRAYIGHKRRFGYTVNGDSFLLNHPNDRMISRRALQKAFKRLLSLAKLSNHYYIHCLRHTYSTFLLRATNNNYRFLQCQLGHSSLRTTQVYASVVESDARRDLEKLYE